MPTVRFKGYVEPRATHLSINNLTPIGEMNIATGRKSIFTISIKDCAVDVKCDLDSFDIEEISQLYTRSVELSRTLVNLIAIKNGWGTFLHLDRFILPDGKEEILWNHADVLRGMLDTYELSDIDDLFQKVACDVDFSMALNDMTDALSRPRTTAVCCARALDTIKNLLAPNVKDKAGWRVVQETLRADEAYLQHISVSSTSSRHGKHAYLPATDAEEIMKRTWELVNRYLYCRLNPGKELPVDRFPQLMISPTPQP